MYSFSYLEPVCCSMSSSNCCFLTSISVSQEVGQVVWYSHLFQNFPQFIVIHTVKGFGIVNKVAWTSGSSRFTYCWSLAWKILSITLLACEMSAIVWYFEHTSDISQFMYEKEKKNKIKNKTSLNIWKLTVHVLLKPGLENFEHYFTSVWDECNCVVFWAF